MNIAQAKREIENTVRAYTKKDAAGNYEIPAVHQRPVLLMGPPGIGKTAIMEQISREQKIGLVAYTITHHTRQSAVGLPVVEKRKFQDKEYTVTEYTMSEIVGSVYKCMEESGCREGILFIDEINCVSETLAPTMLQFLQCKTFGNHRIPEGWVIVAAGNPPEYNKSVREFDMVTLDRIKRIEITADYKVWKKYAVEHGIHASVTAYLDLHKENFYVTENTSDGRYFVTARGWEDLSKMLKVYEELDIKPEEEFVFQYLQQPEIAKDFTGFYSLCRKYETDYQLSDLLSGVMKEEDQKERICRVKEASFDERMTVISLLVSSLHNEFAEYRAFADRTEKIYEEARKIKTELNKADRQEDFLKQVVQDRQNAYKIKMESGLYKKGEAEQAVYVTDWIRSYYYTWKKEESSSAVTAETVLLHEFSREKEKLEQERKEKRQLLDRAMDFILKGFSEGQEKAVFTEEVSGDEKIMGFIIENGCEKFLEAGRVLEMEEREKKLKEEILRLSDRIQTEGTYKMS